MLAAPLTPMNPHPPRDLDRLSRDALLSPTMVLQSSEGIGSPLALARAATTTATTPAPITLPEAPARKRPKLSLQTSGVPITFGKSSTSLALATVSADPTASPTVLNTFNNAYDLPHRCSPAQTPKSPSSAAPRSARPTSRLISPFASSKDHHLGRPYQLPKGVKSILRNGPIPSHLVGPGRRSSFCPNSPGSPRLLVGRKALFPATKKVTFRPVLDEEIHTATYTAKHSDLFPVVREEAARPITPATAIITQSPSSACYSRQDEKSVFESDSSDDEDQDQPEDEDDDDDDDDDDNDRTDQTSTRSQEFQKRSQRQVEAVAIRDHIPLRPPPTPKRGNSQPRNWTWTLCSSADSEPWPLSACKEGG